MADSVPRVFRIFVPVSDQKVAVSFYQRLLGLEGQVIHGGRYYFDCAPVILAVIENAGPPIADHVYFAVSGLEEVYERAVGLGCLDATDIHGESGAEIVVRPWGERSFYVRDPFGNGLCFVDDKTLFTGL